MSKVVLSEQSKSEARQQFETAVERWKRTVIAFDPAQFVTRHQKESQQMREEFQQMETRVQKEISRGARKTDGFII